MKTYKPQAGTHIGRACLEAVALAADTGEPIRFTFNGVTLEATATTQIKDLEQEWQVKTDAQREAYRHSPEGRKAQADRDATVVRKQANLNAAVDALPKILRTDNHLNTLMNWLREIVEPADDVDTKWNPSAVADQLEAAGYAENQHVGQSPDWFNTRERMGRYIAGQAINCMRKGMPPHPVTLSFVEKYFNIKEGLNTHV